MRILLHTIALEPARWTPQRVSRLLPDLLPHVAKAGFRDLEIYEPHLTAEPVSAGIKDALAKHDLVPEILSSYLNLDPAVTHDGTLDAALEQLRIRIEYYGFRKLRLFPGSGMKPSDQPGIEIFIERVRQTASRLPDTEILLETHDGSLADDPATITRIVNDLASPQVGLLYQPTFFEQEAALNQFEIERPFIRHVHLQNRAPDLGFALLREGVIPWQRILPRLQRGVSATLEFVPAGICSVEAFDLDAVLRQARSEAECALTLAGG